MSMWAATGLFLLLSVTIFFAQILIESYQLFSALAEDEEASSTSTKVSVWC